MIISIFFSIPKGPATFKSWYPLAIFVFSASFAGMYRSCLKLGNQSLYCQFVGNYLPLVIGSFSVASLLNHSRSFLDASQTSSKCSNSDSCSRALDIIALDTMTSSWRSNGFRPISFSLNNLFSPLSAYSWHMIGCTCSTAMVRLGDRSVLPNPLFPRSGICRLSTSIVPDMSIFSIIIYAIRSPSCTW